MKKSIQEEQPPKRPVVTLRKKHFDPLWKHCREGDIKLGPWLGRAGLEKMKKEKH